MVLFHLFDFNHFQLNGMSTKWKISLFLFSGSVGGSGCGEWINILIYLEDSVLETLRHTSVEFCVQEHGCRW